MKFEFNPKGRPISDESILSDIVLVANSLNKETLTIIEYTENGKYGIKAVRNHFGSWNNALKMSGLRINREVIHLTKEEIFNIIKALWIDLNRQPTLREFTSMTKHTKKIIISKFGTWNNALKEFSEWIKGHNNNVNVQEIIVKHKTPREPSDKLRYRVFKRDNFKCVICGRSPANDNSIELCVDHIVPYSKGGETVFENLQTLCSECNLGKSDS